MPSSLNNRTCTGNTFIDDHVLADLADPPITDLDRYRAVADGELALDLFVDGGAVGARAR